MCNLLLKSSRTRLVKQKCFVTPDIQGTHFLSGLVGKSHDVKASQEVLYFFLFVSESGQLADIGFQGAELDQGSPTFPTKWRQEHFDTEAMGHTLLCCAGRREGAQNLMPHPLGCVPKVN